MDAEYSFGVEVHTFFWNYSSDTLYFVSIFNGFILQHFPKTREPWSSKAAFTTIVFFTAFNHEHMIAVTSNAPDLLVETENYSLKLFKHPNWPCHTSVERR